MRKLLMSPISQSRGDSRRLDSMKLNSEKGGPVTRETGLISHNIKAHLSQIDDEDSDYLGDSQPKLKNEGDVTPSENEGNDDESQTPSERERSHDGSRKDRMRNEAMSIPSDVLNDRIPGNELRLANRTELEINMGISHDRSFSKASFSI